MHGSCVAIAKRSSVWATAIFNIPECRDLPIGSKRRFAAASGRDRKAWLASCSAFAVALLLLAAMLSTLFEKNLVNTLSQQGWTRELYAISAALTKMRFGIGGSAVDRRIFTTLVVAGIALHPAPELNVQFPDNLRDAKLLQSALRRAQTIDLPPPAPADANGDYSDLMGFAGEDTGLGTYNYLAFQAFRGECPGADLSLLRHRDDIVGALRYWSLAQRRRHGRRRRGDSGALCGRLRRLS